MKNARRTNVFHSNFFVKMRWIDILGMCRSCAIFQINEWRSSSITIDTVSMLTSSTTVLHLLPISSISENSLPSVKALLCHLIMIKSRDFENRAFPISPDFFTWILLLYVIGSHLGLWWCYYFVTWADGRHEYCSWVRSLMMFLKRNYFRLVWWWVKWICNACCPAYSALSTRK